MDWKWGRALAVVTGALAVAAPLAMADESYKDVAAAEALPGAGPLGPA